MIRTKIVITSLLVLTICMVLAGCGSNSSTGNSGQKASADKQVFNWPNAPAQDIKTFDPALAVTQTSITPIMMVFTGLVSLNDKLDVVGQLAKSWKQADDGLSWTFTMKDNLKFSDGTALNAHDVAYSIDRALSPDLNSGPALSYLGLVKDADQRANGKVSSLIGDSLIVPDDKTITIKTSKPVSYFLQTLVFNTSFVVEKKLIEKYGQQKWTDHLNEGGGAGPFKVEEYTHGQKITFVPNENYYNAKPQFTKVVMPFIKDRETAYNEYKLGNADQVMLPSSHLDEWKSSSEYHKVPMLSTFYLGMNELSKPFDNLNIRKALALAINKDLIVKSVFKDIQQATNHIVPSGMPGYNADLKGPDGTTSTAGDAAKAKEFLQKGLEEGGYGDISKLPAITLSYASGAPDTENMVAVLQQEWKSVLGIDVKTSPQDQEALYDRQQKNNGSSDLQFFWSGWGADYPDPQNFLTLQFGDKSPQNGTNYGQNSSPQASEQQANQKAMEQADVEKDTSKRMKEYNTAEQKVVDDVGWMPVYQMARPYLLKSYVAGRTFNAADNVPPDDWANQYIIEH